MVQWDTLFVINFPSFLFSTINIGYGLLGESVLPFPFSSLFVGVVPLFELLLLSSFDGVVFSGVAAGCGFVGDANEKVLILLVLMSIGGCGLRSGVLGAVLLLVQRNPISCYNYSIV